MAIEEYISEEKLQKRIKEMGAQISQDYSGKEVVVVAVLNGAFLFCADLIRQMNIPITVDFIRASSYEDGMQSTGEVKISLDLKNPIRGKHVIVVEDIVDTGLTIVNLIKHFEVREPASLKLASLLHKPTNTKHEIDIDYLGFEIEDKFVIGYGLDFAGKYRELPYIGIFDEDPEIG
jgi:hypoxanthine phosphoribosyltransferase